MRTATPELKAVLYAKIPVFLADLFTYWLKDGSIYRWTSFDQNITYGGQTWLAQGPLIARSSLGVRNTMEVPELDLTLSALDTDFIGGQSVKKALHAGKFSGARFELDRLVMPTPGDTTLQPVLMFNGRQSTFDLTAIAATIKIKGDNVLMNQNVPRNVYQPKCIHSFCNPGCALLAASFTTTNTVGASPTRNLIPWGTLPATPALYNFGTVTFTSGVAAGESRGIVLASNAGIQIARGLDDVPTAGDTISVFQGCSRLFDDGSGQSCTDYANTQHWRGFRFIPPNETAF
jgi:uncharacterized phage protein (TIGR02218 family)